MSLTKMLAAGVATTFCGAAMAAPVAITNASFDDDALGGSWSDTDPTGWTGDGAAGDVFQEDTASTGISGGDGLNYVGVQNGASMFQDLAATYQAGMTYTLSVLIGDRGSQNSSDLSTIQLAQTDGTVLASLAINADDTNLVGADSFADFSVSYNATGAEGNIRIILLDGTGAERAHFDNVRLDEAPVPEPGSLALLGLGGLAVLRRRRK